MLRPFPPHTFAGPIIEYLPLLISDFRLGQLVNSKTLVTGYPALIVKQWVGGGEGGMGLWAVDLKVVVLFCIICIKKILPVQV